jgi:hypothetical protein
LQLANTTLTNDALMLDVSGTPNILTGVPTNFIRVRITGTTTANVETTINNGGAYTVIGTVTLPAGTFLGGATTGDTLTAVVDGTNAVAVPTVYIWRTTAAPGNVTTFLGAVQIGTGGPWTSGGQIGIQLPAGARVDNFAGGIVP